MKIIVDTNLWISFLIGKKLSMLKMLFTHPDLTIYVCDYLIEEFKEVSSRNKIRKYISEQDILETIKLIDLHCCHFKINKVAVSPIRDVKDLFLLSLSDSIPAAGSKQPAESRSSVIVLYLITLKICPSLSGRSCVKKAPALLLAK